MSVLLSGIKMPVEAGMNELPQLVAATFSLPPACVQAVRIVRQSIDARDKRDIHFQISAVVQMEAAYQQRLLKSRDTRVEQYTPPGAYSLQPGNEVPRGRIVVAGLGPAGLFAAYFLAKAGYRPLCVERGYDIARRKHDVERFFTTGELNENSNVAFGEGGAGTFSDGKLTSRSKNARGEVVLDTLKAHGAPEDIAFMAKPHVGTDMLQNVVKSMREEIIRAGGEVRFGTKLSDIRLKDGKLHTVQLTREGNAERVECAACVFAVGQAPKDAYEMLLSHGLTLQPKSFAVGVRIEHPQGLIDRAQYGTLAGHPRLGAAEYRLTGRTGGRGVYTFCMCPGGQVVSSSSALNHVVVNGMSLRARSGENANAAIIVQVGPEDFGTTPLAGLQFCEQLENAAYRAGGGGFAAPAQRLEDFLRGRQSPGFATVKPSYRPGVVPHRLDTLLPDYISKGIAEGVRAFARQLKGFDLPDAVLTAVESRTSAPVRILRGEDGQAVGAAGLYPAGEGAGYAGGIVSAAIDGMMAAERIAGLYAVRIAN